MEKQTLTKLQAIANNIATQVNELRSTEGRIAQNNADNYCQALCALITAYDSIALITRNEKGGKK